MADAAEDFPTEFPHNKDDVKRALRISDPTYYRGVQSGDIPGIKVGRLWRHNLTQVLRTRERNFANEVK